MFCCRGTQQDIWVGWNEWRSHMDLSRWMRLLVHEKSTTKEYILLETCQLPHSVLAERYTVVCCYCEGGMSAIRFFNWQVLASVVRLHCMHSIRCGLLLRLWWDLSVCCTQVWAVRKWLHRSSCCLGCVPGSLAGMGTFKNILGHTQACRSVCCLQGSSTWWCSHLLPLILVSLSKSWLILDYSQLWCGVEGYWH